jgi:tyrosyl-DNA phosphodiesterase-1
MPVRAGPPRLMSAVQELGMRTSKSNQAKTHLLECQVRIVVVVVDMIGLISRGSSICIYTIQWLNEFHLSARGESAEDWLDRPKKPTRSPDLPNENNCPESALACGERVYFLDSFK